MVSKAKADSCFCVQIYRLLAQQALHSGGSFLAGAFFPYRKLAFPDFLTFWVQKIIKKKLRLRGWDPSHELGTEILCKRPVRMPRDLFFSTNFVTIWGHFGWIGVPGPACTVFRGLGSKWVPIFRLNVPKLREACFKMSVSEFCAGSTGNASSRVEQTLGNPRQGAGCR